MSQTKLRALCLIKSVLLSLLVTLFLLLVIAFIMLQTGMSSGVVTFAVIATYVIGTFCGSFYIGKHVEQKRYLWGLLSAVLFFVVYMIISLFVKGDSPFHLMNYIKSFIIIACSGILGGMLS